MFSAREKHFIAKRIEDLLLSLGHPEMPGSKPMFTLHVDGKESWSWADIEPNWTFGENNPISINPFNESARDVLYKPDTGGGGGRIGRFMDVRVASGEQVRPKHEGDAMTRFETIVLTVALTSLVWMGIMSAVGAGEIVRIERATIGDTLD